MPVISFNLDPPLAMGSPMEFSNAQTGVYDCWQQPEVMTHVIITQI
jgi:hypothetical protein